MPEEGGGGNGIFGWKDGCKFEKAASVGDCVLGPVREVGDVTPEVTG